MLVTSTVSLFFVLIFTGTGLLFWRQKQDDTPMPEHLFSSFWVGWALSILFLQIWQLFAPVSVISLAILVIGMGVGFYRNRSPILLWVKMVSKWAVIVAGAFNGAFLLLLSNQAAFARYSYDHGLYHMQMVKWLTTYPLVPGLGILHHRFAFNNSSFLYAAQINVGPFEGLAHQVASTLLVFMLVGRCLLAVYRLLQHAEYAYIQNTFYVLMLPFILYYIPTSSFAGYSTDVVIFILQILIAGEVLHLHSRYDWSLPALKNRVFFIVLLCALGITVKLSFVVFAALAVVAALAAWVWTVGTGIRQHTGSIFTALGMGALLIVPWLVRHIILSGYLLYPSTLVSFPVQWKIPAAMAEPIAGIITAWAREIVNDSIHPDQWFSNWFFVFPFEMKEAVVYTGLILAAVVVLLVFFKLKPIQWRGPLILLGVSFISLLYWFWMAPAPRFAGALFWLMVVLGLILLYGQLSQLNHVRSPQMLLGFILLLTMFWLSPDFKSVSRSHLLMPPRESFVAQQQMIGDPNRFKETRSGLRVYIAAGQADEMCWDMPLPCTRLNDFDPRLSLIDAADMRKGFFLQRTE
jgi:hypothetical protein